MLVMEHQSASARRVKQVRKLMGHESQTDFARALKVSQQTVSIAESGGEIGIKLARAMRVAWPDLTLHWIIDGDPRGLTLAALHQLEDGPLDRKGTTESPSFPLGRPPGRSPRRSGT